MPVSLVRLSCRASGAESIHAQPPPGGHVKENVAAVLQRGAQVHRPAVAVLQTAGVVAVIKALPVQFTVAAGSMPAVKAAAATAAGAEPAHTAPGRPGPAGSSASAESAVCHAIAAQAKTGEAGCGQNAAGAHIHHYGGPATSDLVRLRCPWWCAGCPSGFAGQSAGSFAGRRQRQHQRTAGYRVDVCMVSRVTPSKTNIDLQLATPCPRSRCRRRLPNRFGLLSRPSPAPGPGSGPMFGG